MANISHFTQTVNGISTTYDIHDANAVDLTSNQTVGGIKTFSNAPVVGSINLDGKTIDTNANGDMTYDSHIVDTIEEQGNNYIRCSSGLQICWGTYSATTETELTINFPKTFIFDSTHPIGISVSGQSQTLFVAGWSSSVIVIANTNIGSFTYTAVGRWK